MAIQAERLEAEVKVTGARAAEADLKRVGKAGDQAGRDVATGGAKARQGGKHFSAGAALVKAAAGTMVASMAGRLIHSASDLNEELSKSGVVFGPQAKIVNRAADQLARKFGIVKTETTRAASSMGLVLKASGLNQGAAAKLSVRLTRLATDATSFYNVPLDEALTSIRSGLVGEAEPMRRFGVLLSDAAVRAEAVKMGLAKSTKEVTEGAKAQARARLIIRGMADASGDLARTQGSVANQLREMRGRLTNWAATMGQKALPATAKFLQTLNREGIPTIRKWAKGFREDIVPYVKAATDGVKDLVGAANGLPGPLKSGAVQAALMGGALYKLSGYIDSGRTSMSTWSAETDRATKRTQIMRGAAGAAAVGVLALGSAFGSMGKDATAGETAVAGLAQTAGGALMGFAAGGPIGAAVGAGAGLLLSLKQMFTGSKYEAKKAEKANYDYKASLDQANGAITAMTRSQIRHNLVLDGGYKAGAALNISMRDMVGYVNGNEKAIARVNKQLDRMFKVRKSDDPNALIKRRQDIDRVNTALGISTDELRRNKQQLEDYTGKAKKVPKDVVTKATLRGVDKAAADLLNFTGNLDKASKKEARPGLALKGVDPTLRDLYQTLNLLNVLDGKVATSTVITKNTSIRSGVRRAGGGWISGPGTTTSDSIPAMLSKKEFVVRAAMAQKYGPLLEAINSGRVPRFAAGGPVTPKTPGVKRHEPRVWGVDIVKSLVHGVKGAMDGSKVGKALTKVVKRNLSGEREAKYLKQLGKFNNRVDRAAKVDQALQAAIGKRDALVGEREDFRGNVRGGIASQANVLNAGRTAGGIKSTLTKRLGKVRESAANLQKMIGMGYSPDIVKQVAGAGVDEGLATSKALVAATGSDVSAISNAFGTINSLAGSTSDQLASQMYDSGVQAAQGLVDGLKDRKKDVYQAMEDMAVGMAKALRKALGIKSPSRVTRRDGRQIPRGLVLGIHDETRAVERAGTRLALSATRGISRGMGTTGGLFGSQIGPGGLTPAALGQSQAQRPLHLEFKTYNPIAEPQSRTTNKGLERVANLGLV